jgi:hypothetical protein
MLDIELVFIIVVGVAVLISYLYWIVTWIGIKVGGFLDSTFHFVSPYWDNVVYHINESWPYLLLTGILGVLASIYSDHCNDQVKDEIKNTEAAQENLRKAESKIESLKNEMRREKSLRDSGDEEIKRLNYALSRLMYELLKYEKNPWSLVHQPFDDKPKPLTASQSQILSRVIEDLRKREQ